MPDSQIPLEQHNVEIHENQAAFDQKALLGKIYREFHRIIKGSLSDADGEVLEIGSGIGLIKQTIPQCVCSDIFENPWVDRYENAYRLSCADESASNLILVDVFHHLRFPGDALKEWQRVLKPGGRVILFEPCISLLGRIVYGCFHHEPIALKEPITWHADNPEKTNDIDYYAAQGNAYRVFHKRQNIDRLGDWELTTCRRFSFFSYVASGGFSKPQLYPTACYRLMKGVDSILNLFPVLFATRMLIVLTKATPSWIKHEKGLN